MTTCLFFGLFDSISVIFLYAVQFSHIIFHAYVHEWPLNNMCCNITLFPILSHTLHPI